MYKTQKLSNGLEIITTPLVGTKTITVLVMVATGSRFENKESSGISHFLEHMLFKGTKKRPTTLEISSELDRVGGEFNAFTGKEYTGYWVKVEAGQLDLALDILSDILLNSKFEEAEINREKGVIIEELNMYLDNPLIYIEDLFEECLYGDTPAGRDTIGTKSAILKLNRKGILNYVNTQYSSDKIIISLAGGFKPEATRLINKYFNNFSKKDYQDKLKTNDEQARPKLNLFYKKTDQAHLSLGVRAYAYGDEDEITAKMISLILGGTMSSRLFTELREKRGLAYYVRTHNEPYTDSGYLTTQAGVPIEKLTEAIKIILAEYKKLTEKLVSAEELNRVKQCLIGRNAINLESSDSLASWYARQAILLKEQKGKKDVQGRKDVGHPIGQGKKDVGRPSGRPTSSEILTPEKYYSNIKKVSAIDIQRVAKEIFVKQKLNLAVIGPYKDKRKFEKML